MAVHEVELTVIDIWCDRCGDHINFSVGKSENLVTAQTIGHVGWSALKLDALAGPAAFQRAKLMRPLPTVLTLCPACTDKVQQVLQYESIDELADAEDREQARLELAERLSD